MPYGPLYNVAGRLAQKKKPAIRTAQQPPQQAQPGIQQAPATMTVPQKRGAFIQQPARKVDIQPVQQPQPTDGVLQTPQKPTGTTRDWWGDIGDKLGGAMGEVGEMGSGAVQSLQDALASQEGGLGQLGAVSPEAGGMQLAPGIEVPRELEWKAKGYPEEIGSMLDMVFGEESSFDPQRELIEEQRDKALRQSMERMAAQGMLGTGAAGGAAQDIYRGAARDIAQARQDWRQQEIQNQMQAAQMLFQDQWHNMDLDHQKAMAELMFELERKRKYGDDYDPEMGDYEMQLLMELATSDALDEDGKKLLNGLLGQLFPEYFGGGQPGEWPAPPEGSSPYKTDINGDTWVWVHEEGDWAGGHWEKNVRR